MAWSFGDGFDCYAAVSDATSGYWDSGTATNNMTLQAGRFSGSQALHIIATTSNVLIKTSGVNDAVHHLVFAFRQLQAITGSTLGAYLELFDGATAQCSIVFRSDGAILLTSGGPGGTVLDTYTGAFPVINTWYAFEVEVIISNTAGRFRVRKNGNSVDDYDSGAVRDTQNSANPYANKLQLSMNANIASGQEFDDLYWRSDASSVAWMGDIRCYTRAPASDASVQFSRTPTGVLTQTAVGTFSNLIGGAGITYFTAFTAGYSGTVTGVTVAVNAVGTAVNLKCAIYADNAGVPGAVIASATAPITPVIVGAHAFTFSGVSVVKGTQYWVASTSDSNSGVFSFVSTPSAAANGASATMSYAVFPQASPVVTTPARAVQMSWTYTATPANWQAVAEAQQDTTTSYVYDSVPGHADLYGIAAIASTPLTTFAVTTRAYAIKSDAGTRTMAVQLKSGSSTVASPTVVLTTSNWQWAW